MNTKERLVRFEDERKYLIGMLGMDIEMAEFLEDRSAIGVAHSRMDFAVSFAVDINHESPSIVRERMYDAFDSLRKLALVNMSKLGDDPQGRTFGDALVHMNDGGEIKLPSWGDDVFISLQEPDAHSKMTHPYMYVTSRFGMVPWNATQVELLSKNWVLL